MSSTRSLLWKEWHEQRWKAAFGAAILVAFTVIGLKTRIWRDGEIITMSMIFATVLYPLLVAMGLVATERADGTFGSLMVLPERSWRILTVKLSVAIGTLLIPFILTGFVAWAMAGDRELSKSQILGVYLLTAWIAVQVLIWTLAVGIGQRTEARVALIGMGLFAFYLFWLFTLSMINRNTTYWGGLIIPHYAVFIIEGDPDMPIKRFVILGIQTFVVAGLLSWTVWRFNRLARRAS